MISDPSASLLVRSWRTRSLRRFLAWGHGEKKAARGIAPSESDFSITPHPRVLADWREIIFGAARAFTASWRLGEVAVRLVSAVRRPTLVVIHEQLSPECLIVRLPDGRDCIPLIMWLMRLPFVILLQSPFRRVPHLKVCGTWDSSSRLPWD